MTNYPNRVKAGKIAASNIRTALLGQQAAEIVRAAGSPASHDKFIHHDIRSAKRAPEDGTGGGTFDIIEDEYGPYVFDSYNGMIVKRCETVEKATVEAERLADEWDTENAPSAARAHEREITGSGIEQGIVAADAREASSSPYQQFRVTWEIDIQARSPMEAAEEALTVQRRAGSSAVVFDCEDETGTIVRVDLDQSKDEDYVL